MSIGPYNTRKMKRSPLLWLQYAIVLFIFLAPPLWILLSSFKPPTEVLAYPPTLTFTPTLENYVGLFSSGKVLGYALNSLMVAGGSTLLGLAFGVPASFATSYLRISWPATLMLGARMAPGTLFLLPWFVLFNALGLLGHIDVLVITHTVITMPLILWIMLPYFDRLPKELYEAARVDGASVVGVFFRVALPLVKPGLTVAAVLAFVFSWNYLLFALVLGGFDAKTLVSAAYNFVGEGEANWGGFMAAAVVIATPPLLITFLVQRWLVAGLTAGAVKG